jgi:phosphonoacetaldehyde hydrolase
LSSVRAVIFDWAGTVVDYGSRAPVIAFVELFRRKAIEVTVVQARGPMGTPKKEHIRALLALESVAEQWREKCGRAPLENDIDALYAEFIPLQTAVIAEHADVIPGTRDVMAELRNRGIRIGSTTGYAREMMRDLIPAAAAGGFDPECTVCADQVPHGRPAPWMALHAAMQLQSYPMAACVKVGDTIADIAEGRNAGMWTVGVTKTGNELGLAEAEADALAAEELKRRLSGAESRFRSAGAHYIIEQISALPPVLDEISARIIGGDRP